MMHRARIIILFFILFFCACRKKECRKKEDTVSGDAIELVHVIENKHWELFDEIPDTLFLKLKHDDDITFTYSFVVLNEKELEILNNVVKKLLNFELKSIDFNYQSYAIIIISELEEETFLNVNIKVNQSDSVSVLIDYIVYPAKINLPTPFLGHANDYKILFIKTNKINYRAYEKRNNGRVCN